MESAFSDPLRPLVEVSANALAFARRRIRQHHGLQELLAAFHAVLAERRRPPVTIADAVSRVLHVGSMSVVDWGGGDAYSPVSESTPLEPRPDERGFYPGGARGRARPSPPPARLCRW